MLAKIEPTASEHAQHAMATSNPRCAPRWLVACVAGAAIVACSTAGSPSPPAAPLAAARRGALAMPCSELASRLAWPDARLTATSVGAGELTVVGARVAAHCRVTGTLHERTSRVDGQRYAIGFELRLPERWNGRFYYQANGGVDGNVVPATGLATAGPASASALVAGFAVLSSDAGHGAAQNATFGIDPQARLDYGYAAVAALTPMAKALVAQAYGRPPDRSYIGGCSNGGRHTLVAATRLADQYDGFLVGDPGTVLPRAAIANLVGGRAYAELAGNPADPGAAFTLAERRLVSDAVPQRCDALDGLVDGMVHDTKACQAAFDLDRDVPTCTAARNGTCLTGAQKSTIARLFAGVRTRRDELVYAPFPWDAGLATSNWASWKFASPSTRDAGAIADIWQVPPADPARFDGRAFMMAADADALLARVQASDATYRESALSFMLPPGLDDPAQLRSRGAKVIVYHGTSDPIFSSAHSVSVVERWNAASGGNAFSFARLYLVPGMNHCSGGPSADQFDLLSPLVDWVELGNQPGAIVASVRGRGNAAGENADVPPSWSPTRTRLLCPYPTVARFVGNDAESMASFVCR